VPLGKVVGLEVINNFGLYIFSAAGRYNVVTKTYFNRRRLSVLLKISQRDVQLLAKRCGQSAGLISGLGVSPKALYIGWKYMGGRAREVEITRVGVWVGVP